MAQTDNTEDITDIITSTETPQQSNLNIQKSHCTESNNIQHSHSLTSLSSISSTSTSTSYQNHSIHDNEIYENLNHESSSNYTQKILINHTTPSPKRQLSPSSSPHIQNHNNNNNNTKPSILSTLTTLHTNNLTTRPLSPSPHENNHPQSQSQSHIQHQNLAHKHLKHGHNNIDRKRSSISSLRESLWSKYKQINNYINPYTDIEPNTETKHNLEEKKMDESHNNDINHIIHSQAFMDGAFTMYHKLDNTLIEINKLKKTQLKQMQSFTDKRKKHTRNIYANITHNTPENKQQNEEKKHMHMHAQGNDGMDINGRVVDVMKTLISSTTEMGSFFTNSNAIASPNDNGDNGNGGSSLIGGLLDRLSSSIAYMSYISVSTVTPFIYNMVEAVLLELYATINDIIEYYDPEPKNNILWRLINKLNEIIEAIRGLLALSDCFYEISSDNDERNQRDECSYSFFNKKKEKQD